LLLCAIGIIGIICRKCITEACLKNTYINLCKKNNNNNNKVLTKIGDLQSTWQCVGKFFKENYTVQTRIKVGLKIQLLR
jgi:hypothetical protein